MNIMISF